MSYLKAPKTYNVQKRILIRYVKNSLSSDEVIETKLNRKIVLLPYFNDKLVTYCIDI